MKKKPAPSKVLLAADRERREIVANLEQQVRRLRALEKRLKAAKPADSTVYRWDGCAHTVETWLASTLRYILTSSSVSSLVKDAALLKSLTPARLRRELEHEVREADRYEAERKTRELVERMTERLNQAGPSSTDGELAEALQEVRGMVEQLPLEQLQHRIGTELDKAQLAVDQLTKRRKSPTPTPAAPAAT